MFSSTPYYIQILRDRLGQRQRQNAAYSLRAFARDTNLDASTLSQVLKGRRPLSLKNCEHLSKALNLSPREKTKFMESAFRKRALLSQIQVNDSDIQDRFIIDESHHRVIAEWEHYAVLTAFDSNAFELPVQEASSILERKFSISGFRAKTVLQNLANAGLISESDGYFTKVHESVHTTDEIASTAIRAAHAETLEIGKQKLETIALHARDFSSLCLAFDPDQMAELKAIIREFRNKVAALAKTGGNRSAVYQIAIQAYPLSHFENGKPL